MGPPGEILASVTTLTALGLLFAAAAHDVCFRTVPDGLSVALVACGLARHAASGDVLAATVASTAVFAASVLAWRAGFLGGGDAKLLGSIALAVPLATVPDLVLVTALAGGGLALAFLALGPFVPDASGPRPVGLLRRAVRAEARRIRRRGPLPYAVAIAAGGTTSLLAW